MQVIQRSIVGRLGLQQYGSVLLRMSRETHDSIEAYYQIKRDGRLEVHGIGWTNFVELYEKDVEGWVVNTCDSLKQ